jgi:hypothetical protein
MSMVPIKAKYNELVAFFQWWIPTYLTSAGLYLEGQSAPRPVNPYISFNPLDEIDEVGLDERRMDSLGNEILRGQRIVSCSLEGYSDSSTRFDGSDNAWEMLMELKFSLGYPEVKAKLSEINCRVVDVNSVDNISVTLNTTNEPRASFSFTLSTVIVQSIDNGNIETVNATGVIEGVFNDIQVDISETKP